MLGVPAPGWFSGLPLACGDADVTVVPRSFPTRSRD